MHPMVTRPILSFGIEIPRLPRRASSLLSLIALAAVLSSILQYAEASPTLQRSEPPDAHAPVLKIRATTPGSGCSGSEGQWNCMNNAWQRCASGQWSVVMQCAAGTHCVPSGLTYDFRVQADSQGSTSTAQASSKFSNSSLIMALVAFLFSAVLGAAIV